MDKEKPILVVGSIPFVMDYSEREIRRITRPECIISFNDLDNKGDYYTYQLNIKPGLYDRIDFNDITDLTFDLILPSPIINEPEKLTPEFKSDLNQMSQKEGWGFFLGDANLAIRLTGKLPHIDLNGTDFTVDWRLRQLRETEQPWKQINLNTLEMSESGDGYLTFYNTTSHEIYLPGDDLLAIPEDVVVLEIPNELKLDPVAVAIDYGLAATDLLNEHPLPQSLAARISPISASGLPEFVANNMVRLDNSPNNEGRNPKIGR